MGHHDAPPKCNHLPEFKLTPSEFRAITSRPNQLILAALGVIQGHRDLFTFTNSHPNINIRQFAGLHPTVTQLGRAHTF